MEFIDSYDTDMQSILYLEESLDRLVSNIHLGVYDELFHNRITKEAKALKVSIMRNQAYGEDERQNLLLLINSCFKVAEKEIEDLAELLNFL